MATLTAYTIFTAFDGKPLGEQYGMLALVPAGADLSVESDGTGREGRRTIEAVVYQRSVPGLTDGEHWQEAVSGVFRMGQDWRLLRAVHRGVDVEIECKVRRRGLTGFGTIGVTLETRTPYYQARVARTHTATPIMAEGNVPARVVTTLTPTTGTVRTARLTITDRTGRGLWDHPVRLGPPDGPTWDTTGQGATAATNYAAFNNGLPIPFMLQTPDSATLTKGDFRVNVPALGSTFIDLFWGSGVANTVTAQALNDGGLDLAHATHGNGTWVWRTTAGTLGGKVAYAMFDVGANPRTTGAWLGGHFGTDYAGVFYGKSSTAPLTLNLSTAGLPKDMDGIVVVTGLEAASGVSLRGIAAALTGTGGAKRVMYLTADSTTWQAAAESPADQYTAAGAVAWAIFVDPTSTTPSAALTIQANAGDLPPRIIHDSAKTPALSLGAASTARVLNSVLTNTTTGQALTLTDLYTANVALVIDSSTGSVRPASGTLLYKGRGDQSIRFARLSDRAGSWDIDPALGPNAYTVTGGLTPSFAVYPRYAL